MVNYNGQILDTLAVPYHEVSRLIYGDGFFETMRWQNGVVFNLKQHIVRIGHSMKRFGFSEIHHLEEFLRKNIALLNLDSVKAYRIRIIFLRKNGGFYTPQTDSFNFMLEARPLDNLRFILNKTGLKLGFSPIRKYSNHPMAGIKSLGANDQVLNGRMSHIKGCDDLIMFNEHEDICESTSSNIFIVKDNIIYTPKQTSGCVHGTMRKSIINLLKQSAHYNIKVENLKEVDLIQADEVFLTNAIQGIQWAGSYEDKRYHCQYSKNIVDLLNQTNK